MSGKLPNAFLKSVSLVALATAFGGDRTFAQDTDLIELDPIIITGEKRERDIRETASSVSALTGDGIARTNPEANNLDEAVNGIPNVVFPGTVAAPVIRGVDSQGPHSGANAFFAGTVPRASLSIDGYYQTFNQFVLGQSSIWDIDSIEVFRGPQTTIQGANAIAGAMIIRTNDPTFTPEFGYQLEGSSYNGRRASFYASGPITDSLAGRFSLDYSGRDTFVDYVNPAFPKGFDTDFSNLNGRLKLLWAPVDLPGLEAKFTYAHTDTHNPTFEAASPPYEDLESIGATMPIWDQTSDVGIIDVNYDFDNNLSLYNQFLYSESESLRRLGTPDSGDADINSTSYSYEGRLTFGDTDDDLSGVVGVYLAKTKSDEALYLRGTSSFDDTKTNVGVFGEATYRFAPNWSLTGGLRFQQDRIERVGSTTFSTEGVDYDNTFDAILPRVSVAYEASPDLTLGALISKGYNPGGVSFNFSTGVWTQFNQEESWNYELFARSSLLGNRMFLNTNLFYTDYDNYQLNIPVEIATGVFQSYTINAQKAKAYGLELAVDYQATDSLWLAFGAGYTKTKLDRVDSNQSYQGNAFADAPEFNLILSANWAATDRLNFGAQIKYVDGYYSDLANTSSLEVDGYTITNLNVSYALSSNAELYGYVSNLFDERTPLDLQLQRGTSGSYVAANMSAPRMIGIGIRGRF